MPAAAFAQVRSLAREDLDFHAVSEDIGYGCAVERKSPTLPSNPASDQTALVLFELDLHTGAVLRSVKLHTGKYDIGCSVQPALDLGAIFVATATYYLSAERATLFVVNPTDFTFYSGVVGALASDGNESVAIRRLGSHFLFFATDDSESFLQGFNFTGVPAASAIPKIQSTYVSLSVVPPNRTDGSVLPDSLDFSYDLTGAQPRVVAGWLIQGSLVYRWIDGAGQPDAASDVYSYAMYDSDITRAGASRVSPPYYNTATSEYSWIYYSDWAGVFPHQLYWANQSLPAESQSWNLVTGTQGGFDGSKSFPSTLDMIVYEGTDWIIAARDPATSKLEIYRFPAAYKAGGHPTLGTPHVLNATFCGPTPGLQAPYVDSSGTSHPVIYANNDFVKVQELPSGLLAVAYMKCTDPAVDPTMTAMLVDPDFPNSDLKITASTAATSAAPGGGIAYTLVASNAGPDTNGHARVKAPLAAPLTGCTWTSAATGGATGNGATGSGPLDESLVLPAGASVTYTVQCTVDAAATGANVAASASIWSPAPDATPTDDTASVTTPLKPSSDLKVALTGDAGPVDPGASISYTATVTDAGPSNATGVALAITVPAGLTLKSTTGCAEDPTGVPRCSLGGLAAGASATVGFVLTAADSTVGNTVVTAAVSGTNPDPDASNDSASHTVEVSRVADLGITVDDGVTKLEKGATTTYTIVATNAGPSAVDDAVVTDTLPATLGSATWTCTGAGGGTCTASGTGSIADTGVVLPASGTVTYKLKATNVSTGKDIVNTATVRSAKATDPKPANDTATDTDTYVAKAVTPPPPGSGQQGTGCNCSSADSGTGFIGALGLLLALGVLRRRSWRGAARRG